MDRGLIAAKDQRAQEGAIAALLELNPGLEDMLAGLRRVSPEKDPVLAAARQNAILAALASVAADQQKRIEELEERLSTAVAAGEDSEA